jgi:hypothetical protein
MLHLMKDSKVKYKILFPLLNMSETLKVVSLLREVILITNIRLFINDIHVFTATRASKLASSVSQVEQGT